MSHQNLIYQLIMSKTKTSQQKTTHQIEGPDKFRYLGFMINEDGNTEEDMNIQSEQTGTIKLLKIKQNKEYIN